MPGTGRSAAYRVIGDTLDVDGCDGLRCGCSRINLDATSMGLTGRLRMFGDELLPIYRQCSVCSRQWPH
jgi:hypothetical protein